VWGSGGRRGNQAAQQPGGGGFRGGGGGGAMRMGPQAGGRGMMTGTTTEQRFNLLLGVNVANVLNHLNPGNYQGVITSPQFLEATAVNTGFGGGGLGSGGGGGPITGIGTSNSSPAAANNRRVEFDLRFTF
jgi:hypothetical protein